MKYEIRKKKFYLNYRHVNWTGGEPYWVTDATYAAPSDPVDKLHYHNMYELGICVDGSGEIHINDRIYHFKKGDVQFISHYVPHFSNSDPASPARWKLIFFDPAKLMQHGGILDPEKAISVADADLPFSGIFAPDEYPKLTEFIKKILNLAETQDEYTDISIAFFVGSFFIECKRYLNAHPATDKPFKVNKSSYYKITPAIDTITGHMSNSEMLEENVLAQKCNMSVSSLKRLFKKYTGFSPKAYINNTRMAYAEYLIINTNMTVLKISNEVGYSEVSGFNRIFKATFGLTPSEYRKKNQ